jgi:YD repeat-containing protein
LFPITRRCALRFLVWPLVPVVLPTSVRRARAVGPVDVVNGVALLSPDSFEPDPATGLRRARLRFPERPPPRRLAAALRDESPEGVLLASLLRRGAAGNHGDLYDNRDRGHSPLRSENFPQLSFTAWDEAARAAGLDYGMNPGLVFGTVTIGNSSTAMKHGPFWRSLPRAAMTLPGQSAFLERLYAANHLYVYPEHRDHDPENGDVFPAATAQVVISQGSSGSDRPFLRALAHILAALRPDTKARLRETGLIAPILQRVLRRGMAGIGDEAAYMSGAAHPSALDPGAIDLPRMLRHAAGIGPGDIPPAVRLHLRAEPDPGAIFADGLGERLFDTADAVARVARGTTGERRYRLSTAGTADPNGRPLRFHWRVLRGPDVTVTPLDSEGHEAEVVVPWTEPYALPDPPGLVTGRIDVAVFADNGAELSAPAFFSVAFPPTERRRYGEDGRIMEIAYDPPDLAESYADPALFPLRSWRDSYDYDGAGRMLGWTRTHTNGTVERFTVHGLRVVATDGDGRPGIAEAMTYPLRSGVARERFGRSRVLPAPDGQRFRLVYDGASDRVGRPVATGSP